MDRTGLHSVVRRFLIALLPAPTLDRIRFARQRHLITSFQPRMVAHRYGGVDLTICLSDPLAQAWYDQDWETLPEIELLRQGQLRPGSRVFDLGAHQCVVALILADVVGPSGQVIAVEAGSHNFAAAKRNRDVNGAQQLEVLHAAVGDTCGELMFSERLNGQVSSGNAGGQVSVSSITIDRLAKLYGVPAVLFLDVEGFECQALRGAEATLRYRPDCLVEVHVNHGLEAFGGSVDEILSYFPEADYQLFSASEKEPEDFMHRFAPFEPCSSATNQRFFLVALAKK